jgi:hypothetical protein
MFARFSSSRAPAASTAAPPSTMIAGFQDRREAWQSHDFHRVSSITFPLLSEAFAPDRGRYWDRDERKVNVTQLPQAFKFDSSPSSDGLSLNLTWLTQFWQYLGVVDL